MAEQRVDLALERVADVDPGSGSSVPDRYTAPHLVHGEPLGEVLGEVVRVAGGRRDRVERGPAGDAVVVVVEVAVAEEHRGGVGAQHDLGAQLAHDAHDRAAQLAVVGELAVGVAEVEVPGEAEQRGRLGGLLDAQRGERVEVGVGVGGALVARAS